MNTKQRLRQSVLSWKFAGYSVTMLALLLVSGAIVEGFGLSRSWTWAVGVATGVALYELCNWWAGWQKLSIALSREST